MTKKVLILAFPRYQDDELIFPYYSFQEHGYEVTVMGNVNGPMFGDAGTKTNATDNTSNLANPGVMEKYLNEYEILYVVGGVKNQEKLRQDKNAIKLVQEWNKRNKTIFTICNGAQLLISAEIVNGRTVAGYYSIDIDIKNAGGFYPTGDVSVDGNIVSAKHYKDMPLFMRMGLGHHEKRQQGFYAGVND